MGYESHYKIYIILYIYSLQLFYVVSCKYLHIHHIKTSIAKSLPDIQLVVFGGLCGYTPRLDQSALWASGYIHINNLHSRCYIWHINFLNMPYIIYIIYMYNYIREYGSTLYVGMARKKNGRPYISIASGKLKSLVIYTNK